MRRLRELLKLVLAVLREIGDESAYRRYLRHHGLKHSPEQWRRFSEERLKQKYQRARCC